MGKSDKVSFQIIVDLIYVQQRTIVVEGSALEHATSKFLSSNDRQS